MLTIYRRHSADCAVHQTKLKPAAKRRYLDCNCPLWIYGTTPAGDLYPRQSLQTRDLAVAEAQRAAIEKKGQDQIVQGPLIEDCVERFNDARENEVGERTKDSYRCQLGRLTAYCALRGVHHMQRLTVDLLEDFKVNGLPKDMAGSTKGNVVAKLRCFLKTAFRRGWILTPLAEAVTPHNAEIDQKEPYTDEEVEAIFAGVDRISGGREGYAGQPQTFKVLLRLMLETGLRVSDAIRFDPRTLTQGDAGLWVYSFTMRKRKKGRPLRIVDVYLTEELRRAILACKWLSPARPFWYGKNDARTGYGLGYQVYDRMQTIGSRCGVNDCRPHRLRDTFAVRMLLRGVSIGDLSRLLGHTSVKITETYYAKWVPARARRLEGVVAQALVDAKGDALRDGKGDVGTDSAAA